MNGHANGTPRNGVVVPHTNGKQTYAEKHKLAAHFIGGNKLDNAPNSKVKDFVASHDGHTVITNVSSPDSSAVSARRTRRRERQDNRSSS
jgi:acetyl-CoA carboxylase / biotin carboxylase 1